jgi:Molecular chaperone (small heat shock protein)
MSDGLGLGDLGDSIQSTLLERAGRVAARVQERRGLEADLLESDDEYLVVFDAPGAVSTDVQVRYMDGAVRVRLDRFRDFHEGFEMRFPGRGLSLDGRVDMPDDAVVDPDAAGATLTDDGTLEIVLPKREDAPNRTVDDDAPVGVDIGGDGDGEEDTTDEDADHADADTDHADDTDADHGDEDDADANHGDADTEADHEDANDT